ncbi:MAG: hypothetical protein ABJB76_08880 [Candidatus Nitrosocosmicus sp.]
MLTYDKLSTKPMLFRSFIGLTVEEFDLGYHKIKEKYYKYELKHLTKR